MPLPLVPLVLIGAKAAIGYTIYDRYRKRILDMPVRPAKDKDSCDEGDRD
jgi:CO/xanthine dehydrogenase Mo-binding subunit